MTRDEALALAQRALERAGVRPEAAAIVAEDLVAAEADGLASHGLARLPAYAAQVRSGKVDGQAQVAVTRPASASWIADACCGFAAPAIRAGLRAACEGARETGVAGLAISNSHHSGALGLHVERAAEAGLVCLGFSNGPAGIAPWGGRKALFGTNPIAFACPRASSAPLVIDLSLSKVARGKVMIAAQRNEPIPPDWALDEEGRPTVDAAAALKGTMLPMGDAKGAALALMIELLSAALTGSNFGYQASSFFTPEGPPPRVGHLFLLIDPSRFSATFGAAVETLVGAIREQAGTRLPGERRLANRAEAAERGLTVSSELRAELERLAGAAPG